MRLPTLGGYFGIVPGNLEASEIVARIKSNDDAMRMRPSETPVEVTSSAEACLS
jgi:hypothetical protein